MAEILRTQYPNSLELLGRALEFKPVAGHEIATFATRMQAVSTSFVAQSTHLTKAADTLQFAETEQDGLVHRLRVTSVVMENVTKSTRLLESRMLPKELGQLALAVENEGAIWALVKTGLMENTFGTPIARAADNKVNGAVRPFTDITRWITGRSKIDKGKLGVSLGKAGVVLAGSTYALLSSISLNQGGAAPDALPLVSAAVFGFAAGITPYLTWRDLRDNLTLSNGEELYLYSARYVYPENRTT